MKLRDAVDVVHDLDKKRPDGSAQTTKQWWNICLYHGLIWRPAKKWGSDEVSLKIFFTLKIKNSEVNDFTITFKCIFTVCFPVKIQQIFSN